MSNLPMPSYSDRDVVAARGPKNRVDPRLPYAFLVEQELSARGRVENVATIFLTNKECPFRCVFCDLWKNTTDKRVQPGDIPAQIDYALSRLPMARVIKLYNSGNFFDAQAIPRDDYPAIIERLCRFDRVIVENHPRLCGEECLRFRDALGVELEIAMGLETAHPEVLLRLNKRMTVEDYCSAARFLRRNGIHVRTFVLLQPPFMESHEAVCSAVYSVETAASAGAECVAIIPTRGGDGLMQTLRSQGSFSPPTLAMLEDAVDESLALEAVRGANVRIFADLWDIERFSDCAVCLPDRKQRLRQLNHEQRARPRIKCSCPTLTPDS